MDTGASDRSKSTSKSERVFDHLVRLIENSEPNTRLPSVRGLMTRFGVSQATVTAAISRLERQGALDRRQGSGIYSSSAARTRPTLLLIDSDAALSPSPFWTVLVNALRDLYAGTESPLQVHFTQSIEKERSSVSVQDLLGTSLAEAIASRKFSGVYSVCQNDAVLDAIRDADLPSVGFGCAAKYHIHMAYLEACQLGVNALARLGCRTVSLYRPSHTTSREVFLATMRAQGLTEIALPNADPPPLFQHRSPYSRTTEQGYWSAVAAYGPDSNKVDRPDGVIILEDMFALGFLMGLQAMGLQVGRDVKVASHVNVESPILLAWQRQIVSLKFSVVNIASVMHVAMEALRLGTEPTDAWEKATWNLADRGPFRVAMLFPTVTLPNEAVDFS